MSMQSVNFQALLEPKFRKVFFEAYSEIPEQFSKVFSVKKSKKAKSMITMCPGTGKWEEKIPSGPIAEDSIEHGDEVTYIHKSYAKMISIERELADDDQYDIIEKLPGPWVGAAVLPLRRQQLLSSTMALRPMATMVFPYSATPTRSCVVVPQTTFLDAADLADTSLKIGLSHMRTQTLTQEGFKMSAKAKQLIVHPDNEFTALTLIRSAQTAGTANNDKNVIQGSLTCVVLDYLDDSDAWFLRDPPSFRDELLLEGET